MAIGLAGVISYIVQTVRGTIQPNRVTWLLWGIFPIITFVGQLLEGADMIAYLTLIVGIVPLAVFCASFINPKAYWKIGKLDYTCLAIALVGIAIAVIARDAVIAIIFAILADFMASLPTVVKAYRFPRSESWQSYGLLFVGYVVAALSIQEWVFENYVYVLYLVVIAFVLTVLSARRRREVEAL